MRLRLVGISPERGRGDIGALGRETNLIKPPTERGAAPLRQERAWVSLMMRPYSSSTWTMTSVGAALMRLASIGTLFWSSLMP